LETEVSASQALLGQVPLEKDLGDKQPGWRTIPIIVFYVILYSYFFIVAGLPISKRKSASTFTAKDTFR
jgi:hypothetical protein